MDKLDYNQEWEYSWTDGCWDNVDDDIKDLIIDRDKNNSKLNDKDDILKYAVPTDEKYMKNKQINYVPIIIPLPYSRYKKEKNIDIHMKVNFIRIKMK